MRNDYELNMALEEMNAAIDRQLGGDLPLQIPLNFEAGQANRPWNNRVFPKTYGLVLRPIDPAEPGRRIEPAVAWWNLTPARHTEPLKAWVYACNNARSEDMAEKSTFRSAVKRRRCLIPATAFREWTGKTKGKKVQHKIERRDGELMLFAGLWETAHPADQGPIDTYSMVMTAAAGDDDVAPFHNRQPVLLDREGAQTWLNLEADWRPLMHGPLPATYQFDPPEPSLI
jgi:putative SOS response-associated peptidase YedK